MGFKAYLICMTLYAISRLAIIFAPFLPFPSAGSAESCTAIRLWKTMVITLSYNMLFCLGYMLHCLCPFLAQFWKTIKLNGRKTSERPCYDTEIKSLCQFVIYFFFNRMYHSVTLSRVVKNSRGQNVVQSFIVFEACRRPRLSDDLYMRI